ncbi:MAG: phytanoyl-CoA dioxygenase family protein [Armatimonadetes bacterium]|nr:phytanoyl-CoA dioxygenase family protein [Armatimonadota bacterium]MBS1710128.1 phytanoyl-CoA dioxygenase family protein [Armatimonadota bacterium]MBX3110018.1 phytanoyl-CoA dioxygenase family protein [Fimbriimonadaceae bacterium]
MDAFRAQTLDTPAGRQFAEDGYFIAKGIFSPDEVQVLEADFDRIVAQILASGEHINATWTGPEMEKLGSQNMVVLHTHNVQQYSAVWARAFYQKRFIQAATDLLGPDVVLHHSKLFQKPGEEGAPFPMHQDWTYFPTIQDTMLAGIIHVSAATDEMGCLRVYPGTHKLGRVDGSSGQSESELLAQYPIEKALPLEAEPGDVVFFHYFTIHGSMPNRSPHTRKTVLVQMHSGQDRVEDGVIHPAENLVLSGWNHHATRNSAGAIK